MVVGKIIGIMFMSRTYAHMAHLHTSNLSDHLALNEFYDCVVGLADTLAEAAQGKSGIIDIPVMEPKGELSDPIDALTTHIKMIENLAKKCSDRHLEAIIDNIAALYYSTLYKLKELS